MLWTQSAERSAQSPDELHLKQQSSANDAGRRPQNMTSTITVFPPLPLASSISLYSSSVSGCSPLTLAQGRPKLSLNTTYPQQRTLGTGSTGLRLDTLSADTPTLQNTYSNSYGLATTSSSGTATKTPLLHSISQYQGQGIRPVKYACSTSPEASAHMKKVPYSLSKHPRSILTNGPLAKPSMFADNTVDGRATATEAYEDRPRRVSFPEQLSEDIQTKEYVAQHFDLLVQPSPSPKDPGGANDAPKRRSPSDYDASSDDDDHTHTPIIRRKRRRRDWVWTLGRADSCMRMMSGRAASPLSHPASKEDM